MKTMQMLIAELQRDYPDDAVISSARIVVKTKTRTSTLDYSAKRAAQIEALRAGAKE